MSESIDLPDVNRGYELYITITVFTVMIVLTTTARVIIKLYFRYRLGIDDWFIVLGTLLNLMANGFDYKATLSGFGRHAQFLTVDEQVNAIKYSQLAVAVANWAIWAVKLSVCFFLLSIVRDIYQYYNWAVYALISMTSITALVGSILWGTQAHPLAKLWDPRIHGTRATPEHFLIIVYVVYAFGCFTDVFYALSPLHFLWSARLDWRKKLPIILLTGCGILVLIVGILNIIFAREFLEQEDITWALINEFICDIIERNFSAFVANLPALWLLVVQLRKRASSSYSSGSSLPYYYSRNNVKNKNALNDTMNSTMTDADVYLEVSSQHELYQHQQHSGGYPAIPEESDIPSKESIALTIQKKRPAIITSQEVVLSDGGFTEAPQGSSSSKEQIQTENNNSNMLSSNQIRVQTDFQIRKERRLSLRNKQHKMLTDAGGRI
ncbi:hypothetical protein UA08_00938 [Talaromyces atroroseus]|uniref:Rhodopsin domain-containing protein n=1 Tax=Talaromyces atroroseus TaxID=1441469 RepID=A0A225B0N7_TALAT|nr:hypothetical protein UA08_00938 [Talaromyces atroroseus]OKL64264.1 hypothetical protein UA08_00938 [Talaromyces atroroseus]